ncbi:phosphatidylinositol 4,5-bisphosphate 3-kinase catalytic subunit beta isoform-like [Argiope bruennichi]|uniref:phosphatidylinositol 4,5-bisphosphate 3-kinase catalytic subunit beta isoform-like n=1 Tax=Argiope bruennichi TaxID=94029 RepID=UPI0024957E7C|nr:phosphatidylinositol 4,5-bisphosphate 3-kinase catalytic subunit beta isoform-like [Argiope bruennichi]XP_055949387.1 phosphatidylinositol 4,5-bisphosphate 3-kinase catalytic subunit beta isoform-like [Argiope bruennichi]
MESELNPYVMVDTTTSYLPDVWTLDQDTDVTLDILLPNGCFMNVTVPRDAELHEVKEEVWEMAQRVPLFGLLRDSDSYVFQCINLSTAERDDLTEEDRRLCEIRPFQGVLRLVERQGDEEEKALHSRLNFVIGMGQREFDEQKDPEVHDFRKQMRIFCENVSLVLGPSTWEQQVLRQYPVSIESSPDLPHYLQAKLYEGNLVLAISVEHQSSESTFKFYVPPSINPKDLLDLVLKKKGPSIGLQGDQSQNFLLKICGLEEYLIGPYPISQYKYIRECLSCDRIPELILVSSDKVQLERSRPESKSEERQRTKSTASEASSTLKRKKQLSSLSTWSIEEPFTIIIHSIHKLNYDNKTKVAVQCGLYYAEERLCGKVYHTTEQVLEDGHCTWEDTISFEIDVCNLPRMAKLCLVVYEASSAQKNSRFRKYQDKYACPIAWVNTTVFDYKGALKSVPLTLSAWPYPQEGDEYSGCMLRPLGWLPPNPSREPALTISFGKYHPTAQLCYPGIDEILEYASKELPDRNGSFSSCGEPQASKSHLQQLQQICEKDTLYQLHEQEKELMWFLRKHCCEQLPNSLPKLLKCVKWNDRTEVAQMTKLLQLWPAMTPYKTLELLDYAHPDPGVRSFAVRCLQDIGDDELSLYLLQLVQALKHEAYLQNSLVKFLLERALQNRHVGHRLFWLMRSEIHFPEVAIKFGLILEAYCRSVPTHLEALEKQVEALSQLKSASIQALKKVNIKKEGREKLKLYLQEIFGKKIYQAKFYGLQNPLDPRFKFGKIRVEKCKILDSKMKPLWLAFENTDTYGKDVFLIFKNGDDLRQDMLTLQMIRIMDRLWKDEGLDLRMIPYRCMATGHRVGLIEVVPDADTIANIQKEKGFTATSVFKKGSILSWLKDHNPDDISLSRAAEEFTLSCAGYCVATYVLGVADRHSDNIMVKTNGQLFHVDFGHILGKFKEKFGFKRERVPFVLTHDFVYIITKGQTQRSQEFSRFQQYCEQAFMILRRRGPLVISLFAMMLSTGIPELNSEKDLDYLRETLVLDMSEQEALKHFRAKFDEAIKNSWKTSINWMAHNLAKDNKMSD